MVREKFGKSSGEKRSNRILERWSSRWNWVERAAAYDSHMAVIEQIERERVAAENARKWEERKEEARESGWALYLALKEKADSMLKFPLTRQTTKDGNTVVEPARWTFHTAARVAEVAVKLARLTVELSTENLYFDVSKLSDAQIAAALAAAARNESITEAIKGAENP